MSERTATVRDLRNRFAAISAWIAKGDHVAITKNGLAFATLSPVEVAVAQPKRSWQERAQTYRAIPGPTTLEAYESLWSAVRD